MPAACAKKNPPKLNKHQCVLKIMVFNAVRIEQSQNEHSYRRLITELIYIEPQRNQFSRGQCRYDHQFLNLLRLNVLANHISAPTAPRRRHSPTAAHTRTPRCAHIASAIDIHDKSR
eukprot:6200674-Pleurochrysis_carterae.AAC.3